MKRRRCSSCSMAAPKTQPTSRPVLTHPPPHFRIRTKLASTRFVQVPQPSLKLRVSLPPRHPDERLRGEVQLLCALPRADLLRQRQQVLALVRLPPPPNPLHCSGDGLRGCVCAGEGRWEPTSQARNGDNKLIADMTAKVISSYNVSSSRVFVGGLSAGAAQSVLVAVGILPRPLVSLCVVCCVSRVSYRVSCIACCVRKGD